MKTINVNAVATMNDVTVKSIFIVPELLHSIKEDGENLSTDYWMINQSMSKESLKTIEDNYITGTTRFYNSNIKRDLGIDLNIASDELWVHVWVCDSDEEGPMSSDKKGILLEEEKRGRDQIKKGKKIFLREIPLSLAKKMQEGVEMDFGTIKLVPRQLNHYDELGDWQKCLQTMVSRSKI